MQINTLKLLIAEGLSLAGIAQRLNCSRSNVRYWLGKHRLSTGKESFRNRKKSPICPICLTEDVYREKNRSHCKKCRGQYLRDRAAKNRATVIAQLGGKCLNCGFDKYSCSLDVHHTDPSKKDPNFDRSRGWSLARQLEEIKTCVLLCKNCHQAHHQGYKITGA